MTERRVAIVGCGGRGRAHAQTYSLIEDAELIACCDPNLERREKLAAEFNLHAYPDARSMIEQEKPDFVHLVTQPALRVELMTLVSELGVPLCTVEKPIAVGVADWRALCALERATATRFAISHQFRWQKHLIKCQQALASGKLGEVKFLDVSAGMNIANQGTHTLNYGRALLGDPLVTEVSGNAFGWDMGDLSHPAPAATVAHLAFANGVRGSWVLGPIARRIGDPATTWQHVRVAAYAERGRVNYEEFGQWEIISPEGVESGDHGGMETWAHNNLLAQADFHRAVLAWGNQPPPRPSPNVGEGEEQAPGTNLAASLHEWKVVLAVYTSAIEHRPIDIAAFEPQDDLFQALENNLTRKS
jgi:predicted dehydrogenase